MKNIHLLPTDKPSRLGYLTKKGKEVFNDLRLFEKPMPNILDSENQNIYITSDEEIKEGDWVLGGLGGIDIKKYGRYFAEDWKKIILTTDQDLIKDGVQAIDDEFLEWFVKNPSCEMAHVVYDRDIITEVLQTLKYGGYRIIIPQEEPKQETLTYTEAAKKEERIFNSTMMSKQETLEEAAANLADPNLCKTDNWIAGAKWQQERMYSEEDMREAFKANYTPFSATNIGDVEQDFQKWFEQFKKK